MCGANACMANAGAGCINGDAGAGGRINESASACVADACAGCMNGVVGMCGASMCMANAGTGCINRGAGTGCVNRGAGTGCTKGDVKVWVANAYVGWVNGGGSAWVTG
jgi:hypothetical protein